MVISVLSSSRSRLVRRRRRASANHSMISRRRSILHIDRMTSVHRPSRAISAWPCIRPLIPLELVQMPCPQTHRRQDREGVTAHVPARRKKGKRTPPLHPPRGDMGSSPDESDHEVISELKISMLLLPPAILPPVSPHHDRFQLPPSRGKYSFHLSA